MALILEKVLEAEDLARLRRELEPVAWVSGGRTAGAAARAVKDNLQASPDDPRTQALERFVTDALARHPLFEAAARPARLSRVLFSRYEPGMTYGAHIDDALMGESRLRTDLAFTLFLAPRSDYDGGALVIDNPLGAQEIGLEAGDAILYPAGSIHHVAPVTRGVRLAAVGWVQSAIPDAAQRELLFDLSVTRARLASAAPREDLLTLDKTIANLLRMWMR
jgi:PKHD-type hydroxylase